MPAPTPTPLRRVADCKALWTLLPGEWSWCGVGDAFCFVLEGMDGGFRIPVRRGDAVPGMWGWDGDVDNPTLAPSLDCYDGDLRFHGYVRGGAWHPVAG